MKAGIKPKSGKTIQSGRTLVERVAIPMSVEPADPLMYALSFRKVGTACNRKGKTIIAPITIGKDQ